VAVRYLQRLPLGTPYPEVVERVRGVVEQVRQRTDRCEVVADATGVGMPVVDLLRSAKVGCNVTAVMVTGGDRATYSGGVFGVPKTDLVASIQVLLQKGQLKIARSLPDSPRLLKELLDMRTWAGRTPGRMQIGAEGAGEHDDLAMAVALACWQARPNWSSSPAPLDPVLQHHCRS
jgi:hypothetical protein